MNDDSATAKMKVRFITPRKLSQSLHPPSFRRSHEFAAEFEIGYSGQFGEHGAAAFGEPQSS